MPTVEETARLLGVPRSRVKFLKALAERLVKENFNGESIAPRESAKREPAKKRPKETRSAKPSLANKPRP
jgi:hypothetical protein